jgi:transposase-like protein
LVIDATWFGRSNCLVVYWDPNLKRVQWWRYTTSEHSIEIAEDLHHLKQHSVYCSSITSDGGRGLTRAISLVYPDIPHQRCVTHVQRWGLILLTRNPKTEAGRELKPLLQILSLIDTAEQKDLWIKYFDLWLNRWVNFLKERSYLKGTRKWWYTHKSLRRVRALLLGAIPGLFHYLNDKNIPKTTNGIEGRFSSLKQHYRQHRGLSKQRREAYLAWYLTAIINRELPTRFEH